MSPSAATQSTSSHSSFRFRDHSGRLRRSLVLLEILGDSLACFLGLSLAYWIRFETPLRSLGIETKGASYFTYLPLLHIGTLMFVGTFAALSAYTSAYLLRPNRSISILVRGVFFWVVVYLGTSLALKFEPAISRIFVAVAAITTLALLGSWRWLFYKLVSRDVIRECIAQTVVILGWSSAASHVVNAIRTDRNHPYNFVGYIATSAQDRAVLGRAPLQPVAPFEQLEDYLREHPINILVVADLDLTREQLVHVATLCERHYVAFKIIPSFFQIFISNLRLQTISGVSILGVEALPLDSVFNQLLKRMTDIVGAIIGLALSLPVMAVLAFLIRRESPGPVIYRQIRVGHNGRPFTIYKMRSMRLDAEAGSGAKWAVKGDTRRLRIGAFMREWNLDELPQFWNVLTGDMSLVGPRPERPELIAEFERTIPHYNPRHSVRPGLSGWAQVSGLRGDTSLVERVRYDLFYIENWSIWFDFQIMILTFVRRQNAY